MLKKFTVVFLLGVLLLSFSSACGAKKEESSSKSNASKTSSVDVSESSDISSDNVSNEDVSEDSTQSSKLTSSGTQTQTQSQSQTSSTAKQTSLSLDEVMNSIPADLKKKTITYFHWVDESKTEIGEVIKDFTKKTGIKVNLEVGNYEEYYNLITSKIAANKAPDVVKMRANTVKHTKLLTPLSDLKFNFNDTAWDQVMMKDYTFKGKAYATNLVNTAFFDATVLFYNKTFFAENDIQDPYTLYKNGKWTWAEFEKIAKSYAAIGKDYSGASESGYVQSFGTDMVTYDGTKYVNSIDSKDFTQAFAQLIRYRNTNVFTQDVWDYDGFMSGKVGFFFGSVSFAQTKHDYFPLFKAKKQLAAVPIPTNGKKDYLPLGELSAWGVPLNAPNGEAVPYFLRYVLDYSNYKSDLFVNNDIKSIFENLRKSTNRIAANLPGSLISKDNGKSHMEIIYEMKQTDPAQIATTVKTYKWNVEDAVTKANEEISKLK